MKTLDELKEYLETFGYEDVVLPENEEDIEHIIGIDTNNNLIYSFSVEEFPQMNSLEELEEYLKKSDYDAVKFFVNCDYVTAIIGINDEGRLVYSYDKMVEHLINKDKMEYEDAVEWIDYNTIRALPYEPLHPIVMYSIEEY